MPPRKSFDKRTGIYRTPHPIENLVVTITLRRILSLIEIPKFKVDEDPEDVERNDDGNTVRVQWQEKLFSKFERLFYGDEANCKTDLHKRYHSAILATTDESAARIFTYVTEDGRPLDVDDADTIKLEQFDQTMYIMADVAPEQVLFTLYWRENDRLLLVYPDFQDVDGDRPYYLEVAADSRHMYHYGMTLSETENTLIFGGMPKTADDMLPPEGFPNLSFQHPPKHCRHILVHFEIMAGSGFATSSAIHVQWSLRLPAHMTILGGSMEGCTHSSESRSHRHFGNGEEILLLCRDDVACVADCVAFNMEVISIDGRQRERTEGIATLNLCVNVACSMAETELACVQIEPPPRTILETWREFVFGGRREILVNEFNGQPRGTVRKLNRLGTTTETTGSLVIRYNVVVQNAPDQLTAKHRRTNSAGFEAVDEVLECYHQARERLEALHINSTETTT